MRFRGEAVRNCSAANAQGNGKVDRQAGVQCET